MHTWDLWYPNAAATGMSFARGRMEPHDIVWVHAAPDALRVEVRDEEGALLASGDQLKREGPRLPMTRLVRHGSEIRREDRWPNDGDLQAPVLLPGGEIGILQAWWNAADGSEWRWSIEFYNHR